jgi:hypothetical protein
MGSITINEPTIESMPPWNTVIKIAQTINPESWILVGGLMTQTHAMIAGYHSRATTDIDMLIDVMADVKSINTIVSKLEDMDFKKQEPGLRGTAFHRMVQNNLIVDVLVADHLPKGAKSKAKVGSAPVKNSTLLYARQRNIPVLLFYVSIQMKSFFFIELFETATAFELDDLRADTSRERRIRIPSENVVSKNNERSLINMLSVVDKYYRRVK